jgi:hypothetical protein
LANNQTFNPFADFDQIFDDRIRETDEFYAELQQDIKSEDEKLVQRQGFAGMLWSKQLYIYNVETWLKGDARQPTPPAERWKGRNHKWLHLKNSNIISMPDTWEYPWYAAWDLAFHTIALALVDFDFAKDQLLLMLRSLYAHPNGQIPAYEWNFSDVNPPRAPLGDTISLQYRKRSGPTGYRFPGAVVSRLDAELQLVGEPEGFSGKKYFRRWLSRTG